MDALISGRRKSYFGRLCLASVMSFVMILFNFQAMPTANARNGDTCGGTSPAIVARTLASAQVGILPEEAIFEVSRLTLSPGSTISSFEGIGLAVYYVDSGSVTLQLTGEAIVTRTGFTGSVQASESQTVRGSLELLYSDSISVSSGTLNAIQNVRTLPSVLLMARVAQVSPADATVSTSIQSSGVERELLATTLIQEFAPVAVSLSLVRVIYSSGATDTVLAVNSGPLLITVESGIIDYLVTNGNAVVVSGENQVQQPLQTGIELQLVAGDYVVEQAGVVSRLRNQSPDRTWVLVAMFLPTSDSIENYICFDQ